MVHRPGQACVEISPSRSTKPPCRKRTVSALDYARTARRRTDAMSSARISRFIAGALILSVGLSEQAAGQGLQPQADFENAFGIHPGSPYVVRITVVNDRTGEASTVCVDASLL